MKTKISACILSIVSCQYLIAQDTIPGDSINQLPEIIISYQASRLTPFSFQNLNGRELKQKSTGQEPSFLLAETPSVTAYSDAGSTQGYSYFRIRGMDQTRVNMNFDGVPLNEPEDQGAYFSNYPDIFNSLSRLQIQRGVGTSKNGVASYAGSLQLFSPNLADSSYARIGTGYGSYNSLRVYGEYNSGIINRKAVYARVSRIYSDGYKYNSSNNSESVFVSGGLYCDKSTWKINLMAGHQKNRLAWLGVADSLIARDRKTNVNENERDEFMQVMGQLQNSWRLTKHATLQSTIYHTFLDGNNDFNLNSFLGLPSTDEMYNYAFRSDFTGLFSNFTLTTNNLSWTTGIHGNIYSRRHRGSEVTLGNLYQNRGFKNELSAYTKASYTINQLNIFADVQYRYTDFDYSGNARFDKIKWLFLNPKTGITYNAAKGTVLYYSVGRTGREPTRTDMAGGNDDLLVDSTNGKALLFITHPEYVVDHELGIRYQSIKWNLNFNLYYMDFENEIVLNGKFGPNGLALTNNVERSFRSGAELSLAWQVTKHVRMINNSAFNFSRIREQSQDFQPILTPRIIINQEIEFCLHKLLLALNAKYQHRSYMDFANQAQVGSYVLLNARAHYNLQRFQLGLYLNNLTNENYYNNGYVEADGTRKYFVQAPINFYASLNYSF
ncbi:MAG: TonB-dependent receptor [Chitinophagaceae bacterium]